MRHRLCEIRGSGFVLRADVQYIKDQSAKKMRHVRHMQRRAPSNRQGRTARMKVGEKVEAVTGLP